MSFVKTGVLIVLLLGGWFLLREGSAHVAQPAPPRTVQADVTR